MVLEYERTFLAKSLPPGLQSAKQKEIIDIYLPTGGRHPVLRIRRCGEKREITKKYPVREGDATVQHEFTIPLTAEEYDELAASVKGKRLHKTRHYYEHDGRVFEIDVYHDALQGLVIIDAEFENGEGMDSLAMPDFCLADVSKQEFLAAGFLAGKSYADIEKELARYGYTRL